jgi:membrane protease YdiL (CAAX protease family)
MLNGADFVTLLLFGTFGMTLRGYLAFLAGLILLFAITLLSLKRNQKFEGHRILPMLLESTIYAITMGSLIVFVMTKVMGFNPELAANLPQQGLVTRTVMSLGAGVYEEIVFRLGVLGGLRVVLEKAVHLSRAVSIVSAFVASSLLFSAIHYIPPYGDDFALNSFTFRFLAGLLFALIFRFRGLAVAVYTHAFYDIFVLVLR